MKLAGVFGRRQFIEKSGYGAIGIGLTTAIAASEMMFLRACAPGQVSSAITEVETWVPVGLSALDSLISLINPPAGSAVDAAIKTVEGLYASFTTAVANYQHTTDPTTTLLDKIIASMDALQGGLADALAALPVGIPAAIMTAIKLGFALMLATLKNIQSKLEPQASPTAVAAVLHAKSDRVLAAIGTTAPATSTKDFITKFNQIMDQSNVNKHLK